MTKAVRIQIPPDRLAAALAKYFTKPLLHVLEKENQLLNDKLQRPSG